MPPVAAAIASIAPFLATVGPATSLATAGASFAPWVIPAAVAAGSTGLGLIKGNQEKVAANASAREARAQWQANAFPSDATVNAQATQNRGQLGQARLGATQNVGSQLAARGFGPGSGAMAGSLGQINKGYLESLGDMNTELTKFKNTPMFGFPQQGYGTASGGGLSAGLGGATDMMDTAAGLMFAKSIFPNMFSGIK
jgi:hypothetical protein